MRISFFIVLRGEFADLSYARTAWTICPSLGVGRFAGRSGGSLVKFVTENYPNLDPGVYKEMMKAAEQHLPADEYQEFYQSF